MNPAPNWFGSVHSTQQSPAAVCGRSGSVARITSISREEMHSPPAPGAPSVAAASQAHFGSAVHSPHDTKVRQYSVHSEPVISIEFMARPLSMLFIVLAGSSYSPHAGSSK